LAHVTFGAKKSVGGHHVVDALIGPEMIVVIHKVLESLSCLIEVKRAHPLPKLIPDRLPQALALAYRLRVMASRHHVLDSMLSKKLFEFGSPSPGKVLLSLVGKNLLRAPKALDAVQEGFHDKFSRLL
jgi:hypothetical protein